MKAHFHEMCTNLKGINLKGINKWSYWKSQFTTQALTKEEELQGLQIKNKSALKHTNMTVLN